MITSINMQTSSNKTTNRPSPVPEHVEHTEPAPENNFFRESEVQEPKENPLDVCETEWGVIQQVLQHHSAAAATTAHSAAAATTAMVDMDAANAKACQILVEEGSRSFVNHMFTRADKSTRSYSEMRSHYGWCSGPSSKCTPKWTVQPARQHRAYSRKNFGPSHAPERKQGDGWTFLFVKANR